ncbi:MAG: alanine dehydrogenase [Betaproteobacteria bacterium]|nr:alanine dehydrogenase [Betaproteobacteria bacterium]
MQIGIPKETKDQEFRVGMIPAGVDALVKGGHVVLVQSRAGERTGFSDADYEVSGARIVTSAQEIFASDLVVKVKELQPPEYPLLRRGQIVFAYQQLAPDPKLLDCVLQAGISAIGYETVADERGNLPLLAPMSRIAGRMSVQIGAWALQMNNGGSGVLLPGVPGVPPAKVVVIGAGAAGSNAVQVAAGLGADVTVFDVSIDRLAHIDALYRGAVKTCYSIPLPLAEAVADADLVIGALLVPGKLAPKVITRATVARMRKGSVIVDIAIDQGGISETSRMTYHSAPLYVEEGVVHYCVPNIPAACGRTATLALTQATLPYALRLANQGLMAMKGDFGFAAGLQTHDGHVTHKGLAQDTQRPHRPFSGLGAGSAKDSQKN